MKTYHGSCHCGAIQFDVTADITNAIRCNCSYCYRKGMILAFVPQTQVVLGSGADHLTEYRFNTKHIAHTFCNVCGVQCFGSAAGADGATTFAINLNTLEDFSLADVAVQDVDGKSR